MPDSDVQLPLELIRKILVMALSSSRSHYSICLVSSWARHLALPHLFTTAIIKNPSTSGNFLQHISIPPRDPPNAEFLPALQVRNLWMTENSENGSGIVSIYQACLNLTNIAMTTTLFHELACSTKPAVVPDDSFPLHIQRTPSSSRISAAHTRLPDNTDRLFETPHADAKLHILLLDIQKYWEGGMVVERHLGGSPRLFQHITHLRLDKQPTWGLHLGYFGRLTHFAVPYTHPKHSLLIYLEMWMHDNHYGGVLQLEAVVIVLWTDVVEPILVREVQGWLTKMRKIDGRAYAVEATSMGLQEEWEDEARGGLSVWDRAVAYTESLDL